jgi:hypothetical protein
MKLSLSSRERAAIAAVVHRAPWLGGRAILNQLALYEALELGAFVGMEAPKLNRLSLLDNKIYEVPDDSAAVLSAILTIDGQSCDLALTNAATLRRLDPILTVASAPASPAPAEEPAGDKPAEDDKDKTPPARPPVDVPKEAPAPVAAAPHVNGVTALNRLVRNGRHRRRGAAAT